MNAPRLVVSDIDGTFLNSIDRVSRRDRETTWRVLRAGVPVVFATGRPPRWIHPVTEQLGVDLMAVCANGAMIYDTAADRVVHAEVLDPERLAALAAIIEERLPGAGLAVERMVPRVFSADETPFLAEPAYDHAWENPDHTEVHRADLLGRDAVKLLARRADLTSEAMVAAVREDVEGLADVTFSTGEGLIEFSPPGVTKEAGVTRVAERLGVDLVEVLAFGDMPNDIAMLRAVGCGVAMGNAHVDVVAAADEVTSSNDEDGVARVLERWW